VEIGFLNGKDCLVKKRIVITALKYGVGFGLLAFIIWWKWNPTVDAQGRESPGLSQILQNPIRPLPLMLAATICTASVLLTFVRWFILVRAQGLPFSLSNALRLGLVGFFFNTFLPGSVGGDIIKAAGIAREQSRRTVAVATVLIDRAVGLWGLAWVVALLGGFFWAAGLLPTDANGFLQTIVFLSWGIGAVTLLGWILLGFLPAWRAQRFAGRLERIPKIGRAAAEFWRAVWIYRLQGKSVGLALLLAIIGHVGFVLVFFFAASTLAADPSDIPSVLTHYLIIPIGMAAQAFFFTPGGVGGGEAAFGWLYHEVGFPTVLGVSGSFVQRVIMWSLGFIGYLVYLRMRPTLPIVADNSNPAAETATDANSPSPDSLAPDPYYSHTPTHSSKNR
jgi:uncharacterized protein (TIRG00374 family)